MKEKTQKPRSTCSAKISKPVMGKAAVHLEAVPVVARDIEDTDDIPDAARYGILTPQQMLEAAKAETSVQDLHLYRESIRVLRKKGFSYREVAEWMRERGLDVDHNEVYRMHVKGLHPEELIEAEKEAQDEETVEHLERGSW